MIKQQSVLQQQKKNIRRPLFKVDDLPPKKEQKGGSSGKSLASDDGNSAIPTSLQEFLERDTLTISSN